MISPVPSDPSSPDGVTIGPVPCPHCGSILNPLCCSCTGAACTRFRAETDHAISLLESRGYTVIPPGGKS